MNIDPGLAQTIVDSMKEIINQDLNFFSLEGKIISSTNRDRVGSFHEGAKKVIETKENVIVENEDEYHGAKKGINIPIFLDNHLAGVIGITGERKEVEPYGKIIKQMTEILIKENFIKTVTHNKRNNCRQLFNELFINKLPRKDIISSLANLLNITIGIPRIVVIGKISHNDAQDYDSESETLYSIIENIMAYDRENFFVLDSQYVYLIFALTKTQSEHTITLLLQNMIRLIKEELHIKIVFGIGTKATSIAALKESYKHAHQALEWSMYFSMKEMEVYDEINIGQILLNTPVHVAREFFTDMFKGMTEEEIVEYMEIMDIYQQCNGSIYKCADRLFIHKNTLQYKLNKLYKLTGYNPRDLSGFLVLALAFKLYRLHKNILNDAVEEKETVDL